MSLSQKTEAPTAPFMKQVGPFIVHEEKGILDAATGDVLVSGPWSVDEGDLVIKKVVLHPAMSAADIRLKFKANKAAPIPLHLCYLLDEHHGHMTYTIRPVPKGSSLTTHRIHVFGDVYVKHRNEMDVLLGVDRVVVSPAAFERQIQAESANLMAQDPNMPRDAVSRKAGYRSQEQYLTYPG